MKYQQDARTVHRGRRGPKAEGRSWLPGVWPYLMMGGLFIPLLAIPAERELDSITVEAKKEREELRLQVDQFVKTAVVTVSVRARCRCSIGA
jgi:hypothetical protein